MRLPRLTGDEGECEIGAGERIRTVKVAGTVGIVLVEEGTRECFAGDVGRQMVVRDDCFQVVAEENAVWHEQLASYCMTPRWKRR